MSPQIYGLLVDATLQTLAMVAAAITLGTMVGLPLGIWLALSAKGELLATPWLNGS